MSVTTNPCIHLPQICLSELAILLLKMCQISLVDQIVEIVKFSLIKLISFPALVDTVLSESGGLPSDTVDKTVSANTCTGTPRKSLLYLVISYLSLIKKTGKYWKII